MAKIFVQIAAYRDPELPYTVQDLLEKAWDPKSIRIDDYADREHEGVLLVRKAGEMLFRLKGN